MIDIIEKLLQEHGIDQDIKDFMIKESDVNSPAGKYPNWALMQDPAIFILMWQELRDRNKNHDKTRS